eukprot:552174_1
MHQQAISRPSFQQSIQLYIQTAHKQATNCANQCDLLQLPRQILNTVQFRQLINKLQQQQKETNEPQTFQLAKKLNEICKAVQPILCLPNIQTLYQTIPEIDKCSGLNNLNVHFNLQNQSLEFTGKYSKYCDSTTYPRIELIFSKTSIIQIVSSRICNNISPTQVTSSSSLIKLLRKYLSSTANICEGIVELYKPNAVATRLRMIVDDKEQTIYSSDCQLVFKDAPNKKYHRCKSCCSLFDNIQRSKRRQKQREVEHKTTWNGHTHANMDKKQLIEKIKFLQKERHRENKQLQRAQAQSQEYRDMLHLDDFDPNNEWHQTFKLYWKYFDIYDRMGKDDPYRAEFDFDQARNRMMTFTKRAEQNIWRRASQLFFKQMHVHTGLYKTIYFIKYFILPSDRTMKRYESISSYGPGMSLQALRIYEKCQKEFWEMHKIPKNEQMPFIIQSHDAMTCTAGVKYGSISKQVYGLESETRKQMQIKTVFELFKNISRIKPIKYATQVLWIDLNSSFVHVGPWIGTNKEMDGDFLFDFNMEINEEFALNCEFGPCFHGWANDSGGNNESFYKSMLGRQKLSDVRIMMVQNPCVDNQYLGLFWDTTHLGKNAKKGLEKSKNDGDKDKILTIRGYKAVWDVMILCHSINEQDILNMRPVTFRGITRDVVYLKNSWARQKWTLVRPLIADSFISTLRLKIENKEPGFAGAEVTLEFLEHLSAFVSLCISPKDADCLWIDSKQNKSFGKMKKELIWWKNWRDDKNNKCLPDGTMSHIIQFYETFPVFAEYYFEINKMNGITRYLCVYRIGTNKNETLFSEVKRLGGTIGSFYGFIINKLRDNTQLRGLKIKKLTPKELHYKLQKLLNRETNV